MQIGAGLRLLAAAARSIASTALAGFCVSRPASSVRSAVRRVMRSTSARRPSARPRPASGCSAISASFATSPPRRRRPAALDCVQSPSRSACGGCGIRATSRRANRRSSSSNPNSAALSSGKSCGRSASRVCATASGTGCVQSSSRCSAAGSGSSALIARAWCSCLSSSGEHKPLYRCRAAATRVQDRSAGQVVAAARTKRSKSCGVESSRRRPLVGQWQASGVSSDSSSAAAGAEARGGARP